MSYIILLRQYVTAAKRPHDIVTDMWNCDHVITKWSYEGAQDPCFCSHMVFTVTCQWPSWSWSADFGMVFTYTWRLFIVAEWFVRSADHKTVIVVYFIFFQTIFLLSSILRFLKMAAVESLRTVFSGFAKCIHEKTAQEIDKLIHTMTEDKNSLWVARKSWHHSAYSIFIYSTNICTATSLQISTFSPSAPCFLVAPCSD